MLSDEKILITGPAGRIAFGLAKTLAADNDVWGIARFSDAAARAEVEALGVTTRAVDLAVADFADLPSAIARMGSAYGDRGGLPLWHLNALAAGQPVVARWDPLPYSPIHYDDINAQLEPLLDAATVPATIVNWCGDVPVTVQEWSAYFGELVGADARVVVEPVPGASVGSVGDHTKRA